MSAPGGWEVVRDAPANEPARLGGYAGYQLADYLLERGWLTALFGAVVVIFPVLAVRARGAEALGLLAGTVGTLGVLATLFAVNGISSTDRQRGYFRLLFAKPVRVPSYYLQDFVVRGVGVLGVTAVLLGAYAAITASPFAGWAVGRVALVYLLVGGLGFLLSALTHHDGVTLVLVYVLTELVRGVAAIGGAASGAARTLSNLLPPLHRLDALGDALAAGTAPPVGDLVWVLSYGLGCMAAGLLVLRHRPLST